MNTERDKMLAGELYNPLDPDLVAARHRARDLCQGLNATREAEQEDQRRILRELFGVGGDSVWLQPPLNSASLSTSVPMSGWVEAQSSCPAYGSAHVQSSVLGAS